MRRFTTYRMILIGALVVFTASIAKAGIARRTSGHGGYMPTSKIEFRLGFVDRDDWQMESLPGDVTTHHDFDDFTFSFGYHHWVDPNLAFTATASVLAAETTDRWFYDDYYEDEYAVVGLFFGIRHYFTVSDSRTPIRPYIGAAIGPVIGVTSHRWYDYWEHEESYSETVLGGQFGGGVDLFMGPHFVMNFNAGYNAMTDFDRPLRGRDDFGGFEFGLGFGVAF